VPPTYKIHQRQIENLRPRASDHPILDVAPAQYQELVTWSAARFNRPDGFGGRDADSGIRDVGKGGHCHRQTAEETKHPQQDSNLQPSAPEALLYLLVSKDQAWKMSQRATWFSLRPSGHIDLDLLGLCGCQTEVFSRPDRACRGMDSKQRATPRAVRT
jgi:hypothetical protein